MKFMNRMMVCSVAVLLLASLGGIVSAEEADEQKTYKNLLQTLDSSIVTLRHGGLASLDPAREIYNTLVKPYRDRNFDNRPELIELDARIAEAFRLSPTEENIRALRSDISSMASKLGIGLSPIFEYAMFLILGMGAMISLLATLITKRVVNLARMKQIKAEVAAFQKEFREAQSKRDMKRIHKLQVEQKRILALQGEMMRENFKPMIFTAVPFFLFWIALGGIYSGWVVAWLPFQIPLPFYGLWASCGFPSWFLITHFGSAQIWRKLLTPD